MPIVLRRKPSKSPCRDEGLEGLFTVGRVHPHSNSVPRWSWLGTLVMGGAAAGCQQCAGTLLVLQGEADTLQRSVQIDAQTTRRKAPRQPCAAGGWVRASGGDGGGTLSRGRESALILRFM